MTKTKPKHYWLHFKPQNETEEEFWLLQISHTTKHGELIKRYNDWVFKTYYIKNDIFGRFYFVAKSKREAMKISLQILLGEIR